MNECRQFDQSNAMPFWLQGSFRSGKTGKVRENLKTFSSHWKVREHRLFTSCHGKSGKFENAWVESPNSAHNRLFFEAAKSNRNNDHRMMIEERYRNSA